MGVGKKDRKLLTEAEQSQEEVDSFFSLKDKPSEEKGHNKDYLWDDQWSIAKTICIRKLVRTV